LRTMSSAEWRLRPAMCFIVPSSPTSGHRTLKPPGLNHGEHATTKGSYVHRSVFSDLIFQKERGSSPLRSATVT